MCVEIIARVHNKHQNHNHRQRPHMVQHKKSQNWIKRRIIRIDMQVWPRQAVYDIKSHCQLPNNFKFIVGKE